MLSGILTHIRQLVVPITKVELESIIHVHLFKGTQIHIHLLEHLLHLQGPYDLREARAFTGACACRRLSRIATNHYLRYRGSTMLASQGVVKTAQKSVEAVSAVSACW